MQHTVHTDCQVSNGKYMPFWVLSAAIQNIVLKHLKPNHTGNVETPDTVLVHSNYIYLYVQVGNDRLDFSL